MLDSTTWFGDSPSDHKKRANKMKHVYILALIKLTYTNESHRENRHEILVKLNSTAEKKSENYKSVHRAAAKIIC